MKIVLPNDNYLSIDNESFIKERNKLVKTLAKDRSLKTERGEIDLSVITNSVTETANFIEILLSYGICNFCIECDSTNEYAGIATLRDSYLDHYPYRIVSLRLVGNE